MGVLAMAQNIVSIVSPFLFQGIYGLSATSVPWLCFGVAMVSSFFALVLSFYVRPALCRSVAATA